MGITCIRDDQVDPNPFTIEILQKPGVEFEMNDALLTLVEDQCNNQQQKERPDEDKGPIFAIPDQFSRIREQILKKPLETSFERGQVQQTQRLTNYSGYCYEGEWKEGKPHGLGKLYSQQIYIQGQFQKGILNSRDGVKIWIDGSYFRGQISNFTLDGYGAYFNSLERSTYIGFWMHNFPHGLGTEIVQGHLTYKGQFSKGKRHGKVQILWQNGDRFEGRFKNGKLHDLGCLKTANTVFNGFFRQGKKESGRLETSEEFYEGKFVSDVFEDDQGLYKWKSTGIVYKGGFKEGKKHGKGTITFPNGDKLKTSWQRDHIVIQK